MFVVTQDETLMDHRLNEEEDERLHNEKIVFTFLAVPFEGTRLLGCEYSTVEIVCESSVVKHFSFPEMSWCMFRLSFYQRSYVLRAVYVKCKNLVLFMEVFLQSKNPSEGRKIVWIYWSKLTTWKYFIAYRISEMLRLFSSQTKYYSVSDSMSHSSKLWNIIGRKFLVVRVEKSTKKKAKAVKGQKNYVFSYKWLINENAR